MICQLKKVAVIIVMQRKVSKDSFGMLKCQFFDFLKIFFKIIFPICWYNCCRVAGLTFFFFFPPHPLPLNLMLHELQSHICFQVEKTQAYRSVYLSWSLQIQPMFISRDQLGSVLVILSFWACMTSSNESASGKTSYCPFQSRSKAVKVRILTVYVHSDFI